MRRIILVFTILATFCVNLLAADIMSRAIAVTENVENENLVIMVSCFPKTKSITFAFYENTNTTKILTEDFTFHVEDKMSEVYDVIEKASYKDDFSVYSIYKVIKSDSVLINEARNHNKYAYSDK